jgi:hypothetical protein
MEDSSHSYSKLRILSQTENGYIGQCSCCDHYNLAFGNFLLIFSENGLSGFNSMLHDRHHALDTPLSNGKSIVLPSPIPSLMLSFNEAEMEELKGLFQESLLVMEVDKIFSENR